MQKKWAAVGTAAFLAVGPGVVAGVIPLTRISGISPDSITEFPQF